MAKILDLTGQKFGRLTVMSLSEDRKPTKWMCMCECGNEKRVASWELRSQKTISCGCYSKELIGARLRTHGKSGTKEYLSWRAMIRRCTDTKWHMYKRYGAVGITVCDHWKKFENFLSDMGLAPSPSHTIERIDGSKGYYKENCKWADKTEQARNRSVVKMTLEKAREAQRMRSNGATIKSIAEHLGVPRHCVEDVIRGRSFKDSTADNLR